MNATLLLALMLAAVAVITGLAYVNGYRTGRKHGIEETEDLYEDRWAAGEVGQHD